MEHKRPTKKSIIILSCIFVLVLGVVGGALYAWHQINQPDVASLNIGHTTNSANNYSINMTPITQSDAYVSFEYPSGMTARTASVGGPIVDAYTYGAKDVQSWLLAISVSTLKAGDIQTSSDYMLRKNNPDVYAESQETVNGQNVIIMTDRSAGGFSEVAFVQHGSMLASISLTGNHSTGLQPLRQTFAMVLNSLKWES